MPDDDFKHIKVTAPEEDDVVIVAGAPRKAEPSGPEGVDIAQASANEPAPASAHAPAQQAAKGDSSKGDSDKGDTEPAPEKTTTEKPKAKAAPADGYRETTLEDLEDRSMPLTQKIVIIAAIICIIGAVIYCVAFMG